MQRFFKDFIKVLITRQIMILIRQRTNKEIKENYKSHKFIFKSKVFSYSYVLKFLFCFGLFVCLSVCLSVCLFVSLHLTLSSLHQQRLTETSANQMGKTEQLKEKMRHLINVS